MFGAVAVVRGPRSSLSLTEKRAGAEVARLASSNASRQGPRTLRFTTQVRLADGTVARMETIRKGAQIL